MSIVTDITRLIGGRIMEVFGTLSWKIHGVILELKCTAEVSVVLFLRKARWHWNLFI